MKVLLIIVLAGSYYVVYKWAESSVESRYNQDTALVVEQALKALQEDIKHAATENTDLLQKTQLQAQRNKGLRDELDRTTSSCRFSDASLRLFNQSISDSALQPSRSSPEFIGESNSIESYCLGAIGEYNKIAVQVNNLIDEL